MSGQRGHGVSRDTGHGLKVGRNHPEALSTPVTLTALPPRYTVSPKGESGEDGEKPLKMGRIVGFL